MSVTVIAGRIRGMHRRLKPAAVRTLRNWAVKQVRTLKKAYLEGGHQKRGGRRWAPVKRKLPPPILIRTGRMRRSTSHDSIGLRTTFFNTAPYAAYHQHGTRNMPARPVLVVAPQDEDQLRRMLKFDLERALR